MGSHPWSSSTPYQEPLQQALQTLRHREFLEEVAADRSQYKTPDDIEAGIAEYVEECDADGTCSILDIEQIGGEADIFDCGCACPLSKEKLIERFGTDKPTKSMLNSDIDLYEMIGRGEALYVISYEGDKPVELHFFGMSYD